MSFGLLSSSIIIEVFFRNTSTQHIFCNIETLKDQKNTTNTEAQANARKRTSKETTEDGEKNLEVSTRN